MTPVTVPRKRIGTHTMERVRKPVAASTRRATRGSCSASVTMIGSPVAATVPRDAFPDGQRHLAQRAGGDVALRHLPAQVRCGARPGA